MSDIKKFLDQSGVSTLWGQVAANLKAEADRAKLAEEAALKAAQDAQKDVDALETLVGVLPEGTTATTVVDYVNKKTEDIATNAALAELQGQVSEHENSLAILEGDVNTTGSVANVAKATAVAEVAAVVAGADASFDTLKEIADWIVNDTTGAASMANDIAALEGLVGNTAVATQIANAIDAALKVEGVDKYALAADLTALTNRVKALEDAGHVTQAAIDAGVQAAKDYADSLAGNYDAAGTAETKANAALASAKSYADSLAGNYATAAQGAKADSALQSSDIVSGTANGTISVKGTDVAVKGLGSAAYTSSEAYDAAGVGAAQAAQALTDAKAYTDAEVAKIQALTEADILAAINGTTT